jgi:hypothetical protein
MTMQLALFAAPPPDASLTVIVEPEPSDDDDQPADSLWYDAAGHTIAIRRRRVPNPHFGPWCFVGLDARLERYRWPTGDGFRVECDLVLPDERRSRWGIRRTFGIQAQAAREIVDWWMAAESVLDRFLAGEAVVLPGDKRHTAAMASAEADPTYQAAIASQDDAKAALDALDAGGIGWHSARSRYWSERQRAEDIHSAIIQRFHDANDWRQFV